MRVVSHKKCVFDFVFFTGAEQFATHTGSESENEIEVVQRRFVESSQKSLTKCQERDSSAALKKFTEGAATIASAVEAFKAEGKAEINEVWG